MLALLLVLLLQLQELKPLLPLIPLLTLLPLPQLLQRLHCLCSSYEAFWAAYLLLTSSERRQTLWDTVDRV